MDSMSGMGDMGGMSGMGMSMYTSTNMAIARGYWYGVAACVALFALKRTVAAVNVYSSLRLFRRDNYSTPSRAHNLVSQLYATITTVLREATYPQPIVFLGSFAQHLSPPPLGRCLIILSYWAVILSLLWTGTILKSSDPGYAYKWEKPAFRAAWVSVTQVPLIYMMSSKLNVVTIITGVSYERLNWLHRWTALTLFLTVIVHWSFFFREWYLAGFVHLELQMMPMVKYGFGAWGVLGWMVLTGFGYFRALNYELFVLQHLAAAGVLLWLLYSHVPSYAAYNIWLAISFVAFDQIGRAVYACIRNLHVLQFRRKDSRRALSLGYESQIESLPYGITKITIQNVDFTWEAGQHIYISIPSLRPFEAHPFTIANACSEEPGKQVELYIKAEKGFTRALSRKASKQTTRDTSSNVQNRVRILISGPWGHPPTLNAKNTIVLIAASTGATYTIPLLQSLVSNPGCVRRIDFNWIIRHEAQATWFQSQILAALGTSQQKGLEVNVHVRITSSTLPVSDSEEQCPETASESVESSDSELTSKQSSIMTRLLSNKKLKTLRLSENSGPSESASENMAIESESELVRLSNPSVLITSGPRPSIDALVRPAVESAMGETAVVVCGGTSLTAAVRTYVAALSDERAVHKGTGAQGIYLFTETFGW